MSEQDAKSLLQSASELTKPPPGSRLSTWQVLVRVIAIGIPILGALPTAYTLYQSYKHGIPYNEVAHRLEQYDLWVKNLDCQIEYQALNTGQGTRVDVGACPKTGDIAIKVSSVDGKNANYEWIPYNDIKGAKIGSSGFGWAIQAAHAAGLTNPRAAPQSKPGVRVADAGMTVVCQKLGKKPGTIIRVVKENGVCYRESFSLFKGVVGDREKVACDITCDGEAKG